MFFNNRRWKFVAKISIISRFNDAEEKAVEEAIAALADRYH